MTDTNERPIIHFDRHTPEYKAQFTEITADLQQRCPVAWSETYGGHWVISSHKAVFDLARDPNLLSNDRDPHGERNGYLGIGIPPIGEQRSGFLEMDPPGQKDYRAALNPYLSPAAVARWAPMAADITRACIDERIESGSMDFVDDLANIVPAVMTMGLLGLPLADWTIYNEPSHATVYTPPNSPDLPRVLQQFGVMISELGKHLAMCRANPRPGLIDALLNCDVEGQPPSDEDLIGVLVLLVMGGFDTTTALTAGSLNWLSQNPGERARLAADLSTLIDSATEEFLRMVTPAPGDGRTVTHDCVYAGQQLKEGDRLWLSWAMANRDPDVFPEPNTIKIDRQMNRHTTFGLGVHRCIGSNVARAVFKTMLTAVLERMPDYAVDQATTVSYPSVGVINGMQHVPATFTPGTRQGQGLDATIAKWQEIVDRARIADPVTRSED